jgi:hypothetical protein
MEVPLPEEVCSRVELASGQEVSDGGTAPGGGLQPSQLATARRFPMEVPLPEEALRAESACRRPGGFRWRYRSRGKVSSFAQPPVDSGGPLT